MNDLFTVQWWVGVVAVGLILNLLGNFLFILLTKQLSRVPKWWRNRSAEKRKFDAKVVAEIVGNEDNRTSLLLDEFRFKVSAIFILGTGISMTLLSAIASVIISCSWRRNYNTQSSLWFSE